MMNRSQFSSLVFFCRQWELFRPKPSRFFLSAGRLRCVSSLLPASVIEALVCQESFGVFGPGGGDDQLTHQALGQTKFSFMCAKISLMVKARCDLWPLLWLSLKEELWCVKTQDFWKTCFRVLWLVGKSESRSVSACFCLCNNTLG